MSREKKITKHHIAGDEPSPFSFIGLVSSEPDYRLAVMINRELGSDLTRSDDQIIVKRSSGSCSFTRFISSTPPFTLIVNRSSASVLIRKLPKIDFLIVAGEGEQNSESPLLMTELRKVPGITALFLFESEKIADRDLRLLVT